MALLISMFSVYGLLERHNKYERLHKLFTGILFGLITIVGMMFPFRYADGIIYDGRSIILTLAGFFGGGIVALIASLLAGIYRIFLGGSGIWAGLSTIIVTTLIGLLARRYYKNQPEKITLPALYLLGIITHLGMLYSQLLINVPKTISSLALPVLIIYPIATLLVGFLLKSETEHKIAQVELKKSEAKYRNFFERDISGIFISKMDGTIVDCNPAFIKMMGFNSKNEVLASNIFKLYQNEEDAHSFLEELKERKQILYKESSFLNSIGKVVYAIRNTDTILDEDGNITLIQSYLFDVTELKNTQLELLRTHRIKDDFIANLSHEIRTPLNGIVGMANLIKETYCSNSSKEELQVFAGIENSSRRLIRTVEMVLTYSRLQENEIKPEKSSTDISVICSNLTRKFVTGAENKGICLEMKCSAVNTVVYADQYHLREAIANIFDNALRFTNKGKVKLSIYENDKKELLLDIADTGIGISQEYLGSIFQPFIQEQMGYTREFDGVGLGLSISKKYIELNDFKLSVISEKNVGSTFTINFGIQKKERQNEDKRFISKRD